ncbi:MAG: Cof-type HAD-IIB family hydrolase [Mobilicoccus sp.]|nr:Cof-type HAD-IIB family hydrolase [Mobilicoccus sp.]
MTRRIIFLDVDGTLVDYHNRIPASAVEAIRAARAAGHLVFLCTGRSKAEVYDELWDIGLDGLVGANGGYVEHEGHVVMHRCLSAEQTRAVVDWLGERGLEFYLEANSGLYGSDDFEQAAVPAAKAYVGSKGGETEGLTVKDVFPHMIFGADPYRDDVNKISFLLDSYDDHVAATERFPDLESRTWGGRGAHALFGDLAVSGITKADAVHALVEHLGADLADTIAFGDAAVDIPMLEVCAVGVSMGNGSDDIRAMADHVTADVEDDGLAKAFKHLGLS